jgi:membrane protease YdiL (CAAX protease family)
VGRLLAPLAFWRSGLRWYLVVLLLPFVLLAVASLISAVAGWVSFSHTTPGRLWVLPLLYVLGGLLYGPLGEEPGWRGFALPRLLDRIGARSAALLLGLVWGLWHLPLFVVFGTNQQHVLAYLPVPPAVTVGVYVLSVIAFNVIVVWVYLNTRGSLLMTTMIHASVNTAAVVVPMLLSLAHYEPLTVLYFALQIPLGFALLPALRRPYRRV